MQYNDSNFKKWNFILDFLGQGLINSWLKVIWVVKTAKAEARTSRKLQ